MIQKTWRCLLALTTICPLISNSINASASAEVLASTLKVGETRSQSLSRPQSDVVSRIHTHQIGDRPAATVYLHNLPVLTFVDPAINSLKPNRTNLKSVVVDSSNGAIERATAAAALFNRLVREGFDASSIEPMWEANSLVLKIGDEGKFKIDNSIILGNNSKNRPSDVLRTTNLLRRLMGNRPPLTKVAGLPPKPRVFPPSYSLPVAIVSQVITGMASWYGPGFHGGRTANGERFDQYSLTAAHPSLPFGTPVRVINTYTGRSVVVRINDRGPFTGGRVIDLSKGAARKIGLLSSGVAPVRVEVLRR